MTALRKLRQFSSRLDIPKTELDIDSTIDETCNNGGVLQIVMDKPRKNSVKLLLLMDSGGTMIPYCDLLNELFQSATLFAFLDFGRYRDAVFERNEHQVAASET